jgi:hypothetical protein
MTFVPRSATQKNWMLRFYKKTASHAFAINNWVDWPASPTGFFDNASSSTTKTCGITQFVTTASDTDYALNSVKPVLVPIGDQRSEVIATAAGTAAATDIGLRCDLTDCTTVNRAASSVGRFVITGFISATSVIGYFNPIAIAAAS